MKKVIIFAIVSVFCLIHLSPVAIFAQSPSATSTKRAIKQEVKKEIKEKFKGKAAKIKGGQITDIKGLVLTVEMDSTKYTVNTSSNTQLRRNFWGKSDLAEFSVGNIVNVWGVWSDDTKTIITAKLIRNTSIQKRKGVFMGTVKSKGADSFVLTSLQRGDQTVSVSSSTKFTNRKSQTITYFDLQTGHKVQVKGLWDKSQNKITEVTHIRDFSIPALPTGSTTNKN